MQLQRLTMRSCVLLLIMALLCGCDRQPTGSEAKTRARGTETSNEKKESAATDPVHAASTQAPPTATKPQLLSQAELEEGWIALFDGETLFGWQPTSEANWRVENGAIVVDSGEKGFLRTTTEFADYQLKLEFWCPAQTNSGIFLHLGEEGGPGDVDKWVYELNIAPPENPFPTGSLVQRKKADVEVAPEQWHSYDVTVEGGQVLVQLDGQTVMDYSDPDPLRRGYIGLQLNEGEVRFRDIKLKPLNLQSLFNGQDLSGWKTYPEMPGEFTVSDEGHLRVRGGRGQLESEPQFGDFVLQLECLTHAPNLNSGIFFRCIPGEQMNGYESQIHNGYQDGDRTQPVDFGTGGIFRRQPARRVVADDLEWFTKTLIAHEAHVAVWVNGYQVTDWTDTREPHPNPRQGLRTEPGTLMIQAHDPTTDLSFRDLQAAEMPPRRE